MLLKKKYLEIIWEIIYLFLKYDLKCITTQLDNEDFDAINKSLKLDSISSDVSKTTNLEKINVNNELSSCSLYAIDVTTE